MLGQSQVANKPNIVLPYFFSDWACTLRGGGKTLATELKSNRLKQNIETY